MTNTQTNEESLVGDDVTEVQEILESECLKTNAHFRYFLDILDKTRV